MANMTYKMSTVIQIVTHFYMSHKLNQFIMALIGKKPTQSIYDNWNTYCLMTKEVTN